MQRASAKHIRARLSMVDSEAQGVLGETANNPPGRPAINFDV